MRFHPFYRFTRHRQPSYTLSGIQRRRQQMPARRSSLHSSAHQARALPARHHLTHATSAASSRFGGIYVRPQPSAGSTRALALGQRSCSQPNNGPSLLPVELLANIAEYLHPTDQEAFVQALMPHYGACVRAAITPGVGAAFMRAIRAKIGNIAIGFVTAANEGLPDAAMAQLDTATRETLARILMPLGSSMRLPQQLRGSDHTQFAQRFEQHVEAYQVYLAREPIASRHLRIGAAQLPVALQELAELCVCPPVMTALQRRTCPDLPQLIEARDASLAHCATQARELQARMTAAISEPRMRHALAFIQPLSDAVDVAFTAVGRIQWLLSGCRSNNRFANGFSDGCP